MIRSLHRLLKSAFRFPLHCRPRLDVLEDRLTPVTFKVTSFADVLDPGNGLVSLRGAISAANATTELDTIKLKAGLYKINIPEAAGGANDNASGDFDVTKPLILKGKGAGVTVIESNNAVDHRERLFDLIGVIEVGFTNLTLRKSGNFDGFGGAIQAEDANILMTGCVVSDCYALKGGGINAEHGDVTLMDSVVSRNVCHDLGGGINLGGGTLELTNSRVRHNVASNDGGGLSAPTLKLTSSTVSGNYSSGDGGGISATTANVTGSTVSGNVARQSGAGILAEIVNLTGSVISGNFASDDGGGISAGTANLTNSTVRDNIGSFGGGLSVLDANLTGSTVSGNYASINGGGIDTPNGTATLTNSTVSGNFTNQEGGGIHADTINLANSTITENSANFGGGIVLSPGGASSIKNSIIAQNLVSSTVNPRDVSGNFTSQGHNLIGDPTGSTGFANNVNGDLVGALNNPLDPELAPLADNGGPTQTHALLPGSPAIDHGDNAAVDLLTGAPLTTDQRGVGFPRKKDGNVDANAVVDIGALER